MEYSAREAMDRYAAIAKAIGVESETDEQTVRRLVEAVIRLLREVNEPVSFREMGICWEDYHTKLGDLVNRAMESTGTVANPRVPTPEEYRKLFICAFKGERVPFSE
jgi:alcohol dehydrogenase class IV